jgi:hypothetical protein
MLSHEHPRGRRQHRVVGTICGLFVGVAAIALWMFTFSPHGGVELSAFLFPLSRVVLAWLYPAQSVPVGMWYGGALLEWVLIGSVVDVVRLIVRHRRAAEVAA